MALDDLAAPAIDLDRGLACVSGRVVDRSRSRLLAGALAPRWVAATASHAQDRHERDPAAESREPTDDRVIQARLR